MDPSVEPDPSEVASSESPDPQGGGGGGSAPVILSLSTNAAEITEGQSIRITAVVTDPDGIDDLIGGQLLAADESSYGAFSTAAQEGAYEVVVSWDELDAVVPISGFDRSTTRQVMARFYDVAGHQVQQLVSFDLTCPAAACDGRCVDLDRDPDHCGACGHACDAYPGVLSAPTCDAGACVVASGCVALQDRGGCTDACAAAGLGGCVTHDGRAGWVYDDPSCGDSSPLELPACADWVETLPGYWFTIECTCLE